MRRLLFFFLTAVLFTSCSDTASSLQGRWELDEIDYTAHYKSIPEEVRSMLREAMDKAFKKLKGRTFFTFSENEVLSLEAPNFINQVKTTEGRWHLNDAQDSLQLILSNEVENYRIDKIDGDRLVLSTDEVPARTLILVRKTK